MPTPPAPVPAPPVRPRRATTALVDRLAAAYGAAPFLHQDVLALAGTPRQLCSALAAGLQRVHRGVYVVAAPAADRTGCPDPSDPPDPSDCCDSSEHPDPAQGRAIEAPYRDAHLRLLLALRTQVSPKSLASHDSAALLHGLARPAPGPPSYVSFLVPGQPDFRGVGLRVRGSAVPVEQRVVVDGVAATSLSRTAVDLARGRRLPDALVPLDSALRLLIAGRTGTSGNALRHAVRDPAQRAWARAQLTAAQRAVYGWPGTVAVREALEVADPAAESAAESRCRGWLLQAHLPTPEVGAPITVRSGRTFWADLLWRAARVLGEVDGWGKYGVSGADVRAAFRAQQERQAQLQDEGYQVVRWSSTDRRVTVLARLARAGVTCAMCVGTPRTGPETHTA